jgi:3',5'-cyclic AMP phosphodiesterase CpdA
VDWLGVAFGGDPSGAELALFERAIEHANRLRPDFVVICGDLVNVPGDPAQTEAFRRIAARLDPRIPLHLVPGHHDVGNVPSPDSLRAWRETFGPDWYSFRHGDVYGIVLDSSLIAAPWRVQRDAEAQLDWLEAELARAYASDARSILVFQHHPYFVEDPEEDDGFGNVPRLERRVYLKRLRDGRVDAVFAGHLHRNATAQDGKLEMIVTGPVGKPFGDDPSGFRIVRVGEEGLEHAYFAIAAPP